MIAIPRMISIVKTRPVGMYSDNLIFWQLATKFKIENPFKRLLEKTDFYLAS